jgi:hypothetical protein
LVHVFLLLFTQLLLVTRRRQHQSFSRVPIPHTQHADGFWLRLRITRNRPKASNNALALQIGYLLPFGHSTKYFLNAGSWSPRFLLSQKNSFCIAKVAQIPRRQHTCLVIIYVKLSNLNLAHQIRVKPRFASLN